MYIMTTGIEILCVLQAMIWTRIPIIRIIIIHNIQLLLISMEEI